jgi:thiamine transporter
MAAQDLRQEGREVDRDRTRILVEAALCVALAAVLNLVRIWHMPMGGSVSLEMLPIVVFALRRGLVPGMAVGVAYGVVDLFLEPQVVHWAQFLLDYPVAYAMVGVAGVFHQRGAAQARVSRVPWARPLAGVAVAGLLRTTVHWVSGFVFFAAYAPAGQPAWIYSLAYNGTYMVPSIILTAVAAAVVLPVLDRASPPR